MQYYDTDDINTTESSFVEHKVTGVKKHIKDIPEDFPCLQATKLNIRRNISGKLRASNIE
jgi:hypothetical protein